MKLDKIQLVKQKCDINDSPIITGAELASVILDKCNDITNDIDDKVNNLKTEYIKSNKDFNINLQSIYDKVSMITNDIDDILKKNNTLDIKRYSDSIDLKIINLTKDINDLYPILKEHINQSIQEYNKQLNIPVLNKDEILNQLTIDNIVDLKKPINITNILDEPNITKVGIIYYNPIMEKLRIKTSHGWQSVKLE